MGPPRGVAPPGSASVTLGRSGSFQSPRPGAPSAAGAAKNRFGVLKITVQSGKDYKPVEGINPLTADSFIILRVGSVEHVTPICFGGGLRPRYDAEVQFDIRTERDLDVTAFFRTPSGEDIQIGRGRANFMPWIAAGQSSGDVQLKDAQGNSVGSLQVTSRFERTVNRPEGTPLSSQITPGAPGSLDTSESPMAGTRNRDPQSLFTDKEIRDAFVSFDLDKNGYVGAGELRHVLISIGENVTDEEVDEMINMCDRDGDGQVSFDEFYRMITGGRAPPPGLYGSGDNTRTAIIPDASSVSARNVKRTLLEKFAREHTLTLEGIKRAHKRALAFAPTASKNGMFDVLEFSDFCDVLQVPSTGGNEKLFRTYDYDNSGQVSLNEILVALTNFVSGDRADKVTFAFKAYDPSSQGVIARSDVVKILKALHMVNNEQEIAKKVCFRPLFLRFFPTNCFRPVRNLPPFHHFTHIWSFFPSCRRIHSPNNVHKIRMVSFALRTSSRFPRSSPTFFSPF